MDVRTIVVFRSAAFNTDERKPNYLNDGCFGDDVARWLIARLRANGIATDAEPGQEDFGWYIRYRTPDGSFCFVVGYRPGEPEGDWIGTVERDCGFIASLFGGRSRGISPSAVRVLDAVFQAAPELTAIAWHRRRDFDRGDEGRGARTPEAS